MRTTRFVSWLAGALLAATAPAFAQAPVPRLAPSQSIPPAELGAFVDGVVRQAMDGDHVAGVTVAVVQDGKLVLKKGYGFADLARGRRVEADTTLFRIGSITKTFTWLMALNAIDAGKMTLDAPINSYLPAKVQVPAAGFKQQIRLRDLMTHTPGFEDRVLTSLFFTDPARLQPLDDYLASHRPARIWEPGTVTAYSNYGAALAGAAVAHAQGQPWPDLLEREILRPAGMTRTTGRLLYPARAGLPAPMPQALAQDFALNYHWTGSDFVARARELDSVGPAGAIASTGPDMARYMMLLLNGGVLDGQTVFGPKAAATLRTPMRAYPGEASINAGVWQTPGPGPFTAYGHNGGTIDFNANMTLVPDLRLGVFVATNTDRGARLIGTLAWAIGDRFYVQPTAPLPPAPSLLREAAVYQGEFVDTRRPFRGLEAFAFGLRATPVSVAAPGYLVVGGQRFVPAGAPGRFRQVENPRIGLQAVLEDGRATRFIATGSELQRRDVLHQTRTVGIAAATTALASLAVLAGLFSPARWRAPQTRIQRIAGSLRGLAAALWPLAIVAFVAKFSQAMSDPGAVAFDWPGPMILTASTAALAAAILSAAAAALTPFAWSSGDGWSAWRKLRFTTTIAVFSAFALLLALLGALQPWNP